MMHWYGGGFPVMWMGMGLFWIVLVGAIVWLVVELTHPRRGETAPQPPIAPAPYAAHVVAPDSPLELLDRRLAAGQIEITAYREIRAALLEGRGSGS